MKTLLVKYFGEYLGQKRGALNLQIQPLTDPIPQDRFLLTNGMSGKGPLGFRGQVWDLKFLRSFPGFFKKEAGVKKSWITPGSPDILLPDVDDRPRTCGNWVQLSQFSCGNGLTRKLLTTCTKGVGGI